MATTISAAASEVIERMVIAQGVGAHPTTAMIEGFVRGGFKRLWAVVPPIFRGAFTVSATYGVTTVHANLTKICYVNGPRDLFVPAAEYVETETGLNFRRGQQITEGEEIIVWFTTAPTDFGAAASIESSCVFGPDWLEEAVLMYAEIQTLQRMARVHDSGITHDASSGQQLLDQTFRRHLDELITTRREWQAEMNQHLNLRLESKRLAAQPGLEHWGNESTRPNSILDRKR